MASNPPAFPGQPRGSDGAPCGDHIPGMTLRDWFAGQALAGLCAAFARAQTMRGEPQSAADARWAYERADAMLAERAK